MTTIDSGRSLSANRVSSCADAVLEHGEVALIEPRHVRLCGSVTDTLSFTISTPEPNVSGRERGAWQKDRRG